MSYLNTEFSPASDYEAQDISNQVYPLKKIILEKQIALLKIPSVTKRYNIKNNILTYNPDYYTQNIYLKPYFYTIFLHNKINFFSDPVLEQIYHYWHCYNYFVHPKKPLGFKKLKKELQVIYFNCENKIDLVEELFWMKTEFVGQKETPHIVLL